MKKLFLSFGLIGVFFLYGLHQQQEKADVKVVPPQNNPTPTDQSTVDQQTSTTGSSAATPPPAAPTQASEAQPTTSSAMYKDGSYVGSVEDAFYGNIQVKAIIQNGKISDVQFLQYPNDRGESIMINTQAIPYLKQETIQAQGANVNIVSGATDSSEAFVRSLGSALAKAK